MATSQQKFSLVSQFQGYATKVDPTNAPEGILVTGSRNVVINQGDRVASRQGYTLDGQAATALTPIESSYDWKMHNGQERNLRSYDDELEYRYVDSAGTVTWRRLADAFTSVQFNFAEFWDTTENIDRLLFVNGTSNIFDWSGGVTTFASATVNTITKQGTAFWTEEDFYTAGTRRVIIDGTAYTYTGGEGTLTLTGVTPDPTLGAHAVGSIIHQQIRTTANSSMTGLPAAFENDLISILYNQVYIGSLVSREVYVSAVDSFTDYSFTTPVRLAGEGAILTLDATPTALHPQENGMYISAGTTYWYYTLFQLAADNEAESLTVQKLKTTGQGAAQSQAVVAKIKNNLIFLTFEPTIDTLGPIELVQNPQQTNLSDPIKPDFAVLDFTNASLFYFRDQVFLSVPNESLVYIYNLSSRAVNDIAQSGSLQSGTFQKFWQAPQILPISRFSIIDGELYGHSNAVPETYKLFDGYNDNGNPIEAIAAFSYTHYGDRVNLKVFDQYYAEGYISSNTELMMELRYGYKGYAGTKNFTISGSDSQIVFDTSGDGSLGKQSLGTLSLGGGGETISDTLPPKFQVIKTMPTLDFRELQVEFTSNDVDQRWEILAIGPQVRQAVSLNSDISQ